MIKSRRRQPAAPDNDGAHSESGATHNVGYGNPPKEHQFRKGQSGNPKGRPKGAKGTAALLNEILDRKIKVRTGNSVRKISIREAMLTRFAESALKGNTKSAAFLLRRDDLSPSGEDQEDEPITQEEQEIIDAYMETRLNSKGLKK